MKLSARKNRKKEYCYFVSYTYVASSGQNYGHRSVSLSVDSVNALQSAVQRIVGHNKFVIISFQKLEQRF